MGCNGIRMRELELDCASTMFVLGRNERRNYLIRLSVTLYEPVEKDVLQAALEKTVQKYPYFFIRFVIRQNQVSCEPTESIPEVREKKDISSLHMHKEYEKCEAQVTYFHKIIILEYFHAVSDGKGGMNFLLNLTAEYLSLKYQDETILKGIPAIPIHEQTVNGYRECANGFRTQRKRGTVYKIKGTHESTATMNISSYHLSVDEIKRFAKKYEVSVTEFMAAILYLAIWNIQKETYIDEKWKKIRLSVPVNLRTRIPYNTMRNFTLNVYPEIDPKVEAMELSTICKTVHKYMKSATGLDQLKGRCASAAKASDGVFMKILPIFIKRLLVQAVLDLPFTGSTMTFSNIGVVRLPETMKAHIDDCEMVFSAKPEALYSCSMLTVNNKIRITFLRTIKEPLLELQLEKIMYELNFEYKEINDTNSKEK